MRHLLPALLLLSACATELPTAPPEEAFVAGEYVIGLSDDATGADLTSVAAELGLEVLARGGSDRLAVLRDAGERHPDEVLDALERSTVAAFAERQVFYEASFQPDDWRSFLWGQHNDGSRGGTAGADVGAFEAWEIATGRGVVVAVIDTGVDVRHPDLEHNLWTNEGEVPGNGVDDDGNGFVDDVHGFDFVDWDGDPDDRVGHGTHVAGTIAASADDGYGVPGLAFDSRLMCLKLLDINGGGGSWAAAEAINYAVNNGASVINASWGSYGYSTALRNAIASARARGVVFVAAAGNEAQNADINPMFPAAYELDNIISVAASDRNDRIAGFSNYGAGSVDLAAPGVEIVSTWIGQDGWAWQDGTSMASPHVAAAAALVREAAPDLSPRDLAALLMETSEPLAQGAGDVASGGRLDVHRALVQITGGVSQEPSEPSEPSEPTEPEQPAPGAWTFVPFPVESAHPYANDYAGQVGIDAPSGASELKLHFGRIDVEAAYDFVVLRDDEGVKLAEWTGDLGAVESAAVPAGALSLHLFTDGSVTGWGLKLDGFSWR